METDCEEGDTPQGPVLGISYSLFPEGIFEFLGQVWGLIQKIFPCFLSISLFISSFPHSILFLLDWLFSKKRAFAGKIDQHQ